jgi:ketosteroid isomerase-like protein
MTETDLVRLALRFANEINRHDVDGLIALVSDDHLFVDALGQEVHGREKLRAAWKGYFDLFPDYHMDIRETFQSGRVVAFLGSASGTLMVNGESHAENRWKVPAAWRAVVDQGRVVHWQVYADNEPARRILAAKGDGSAGPRSPLES